MINSFIKLHKVTIFLFFKYFLTKNETLCILFGMEPTQIGKKIKALREDKGLTLAEVSERCGVAPATLSRIENGRMVGKIDSHRKICEALGIHLAELYRDLRSEQGGVPIESETEKKDVFVHDEKTSSIILTSQVLSKKMIPILIRLAPQGKTHTEEASDPTEKFLYCLEGNVRVTVGGKSYSLNPGDRLYFDATLQHFIENVGKGEARCLSVSSPPSL